MRLSQGAQDGAAVALATGALGDDAFELGSHVVQFADAVVDVRQMLSCDDVDVAAGHRRVVVEAEKAADLFQTETELAAAADEAQPVDLGGAVFPVAAGGAGWGGHQTRALVIADGFQVTAAGGRRLTDFHSHYP